MIRILQLRWWVLACALGLAGLAAVLFRTADVPVDGNVVIAATAPVVKGVPASAAMAREPVLIGVLLDRARSTAQFRLADGSKRSVGVNQLLQPGWTLVGLDSASATFGTPMGRKRIELGEEFADAATRLNDRPTVLIPEAVAKTEDGELVVRCTDPEC